MPIKAMIHTWVGTLFTACRDGTQTPDSGSREFKTLCTQAAMPELPPLVWAVQWAHSDFPGSLSTDASLSQSLHRAFMAESQEINETAEKREIALLNFLMRPLETRQRRRDPNENPPAPSVCSKLGQLLPGWHLEQGMVCSARGAQPLSPQHFVSVKNIHFP